VAASVAPVFRPPDGSTLLNFSRFLLAKNPWNELNY
jgi:hypothetical protein